MLSPILSLAKPRLVTGLSAGPYALCVVVLPGDARDPRWAGLGRLADAIHGEASCEPLAIEAAPAIQHRTVRLRRGGP
jgi:hypothetical protein